MRTNFLFYRFLSKHYLSSTPLSKTYTFELYAETVPQALTPLAYLESRSMPFLSIILEMSENMNIPKSDRGNEKALYRMTD